MHDSDISQEMKESGVTFRIPITKVRSAAAASQGRCAGDCGLIIACMI